MSTDSSIDQNRDVLLRPATSKDLFSAVPAHYSHIRFDSHERCNLFCAYCYHSGMRAQLGRDAPNEKIQLDAFEEFLTTRVLSVDVFQMGCGYEPYLDPRFPEFMRAVRRARPELLGFAMISNGTLLHRQSPELLNEIGLRQFVLSIDTINPALNAELRGGDLNQILSNFEAYKRACPSIRFVFSVVVTNLNLPHLEELVGYAVDHGVQHIEFRQVNLSHFPAAPVVRDIGMTGVTPEQFETLESELEPFRGKISMRFDCAKQQTLQDRRYKESLAIVQEAQ